MAARLAVRPRGQEDQADRSQARTRTYRGPADRHPGARRLSSAPARRKARTVTALAPAKINLYLHLTGRRGDGYHLVDSLVAFADIGDRVTAAPGETLALTVAGPEAHELAGLGDDNLVLRAARLLQARERVAAGASLRLDKELPVASGIGGGSSDAAAALHALSVLWGCRLDPEAAETAAWAAALGADVPACLAGRTVWVGGIGEELEAADDVPELAVVLANPRIALPTAAVFRARRGGFSPSGRFAPIPRDAAAFAAALAERRNDLTEAAIGLVPEIGQVLEALGQLPDVLLARMSGSGATCFALLPACDAAERAAALLARAHPGWWVRAGALMRTAPSVQPAE